MTTERTATIIGGGVIGASWAALFLAHGMKVIFSDPASKIEEIATPQITAALAELASIGHEHGRYRAKAALRRAGSSRGNRLYRRIITAMTRLFAEQIDGPEKKLMSKQNLNRRDTKL